MIKFSISSASPLLGMMEGGEVGLFSSKPLIPGLAPLAISPHPNQFSSVQSLSRVLLFVTPLIAACQASLSITNSQSPPKPMSTESVMPSNHLILCHPLLLLPSIFPSIRVFSNESALCIWRRQWQPTPVLLPGESQGQGSLVGCRLCSHTELDMTEET